MKIIKNISEITQIVSDLQKNKKQINLIPTMGNIHAGHLSLLTEAKKFDGINIVSIFVNPAQFNEENDFTNYPKTFDTDVDILAKAHCEIIFAPSIKEIYPRGANSKKTVFKYRDILCDISRSGHFDGVTQIVAKLLNQVTADRAFFGEKDWQQLTVIRRLVRDLDISTKIVSVATVRDEFGLALSSRNSYLDSSQLNIARKLSSILQMSAYNIASGGYSSVECAQAAQILLESGFEKIDYLECRNSHSLDLIERTTEDECRIFAAVYINNVRLIDNHVVV